MFIGADYYPEHWPRDRWETDAQLMEAAHFNIVRLAEFSWIKMEPHEGEYDFCWLDEAIELLGRHGIRSIVCTPTATMPKWLYDKYPDTVAISRDGQREHFGNRQINCFSSGTYRLLSQKITLAMARHYADNPNVVGWQLDNEFGGPICFCTTCEHAFQDWLRKKYATIENVNEQYGTIFWSQSYHEFSEIQLPRHLSSNPSLDLDFKRFHSENVVSFASEQADIIRTVCPGHFVTHNMMGFAVNINYYDLGKLLDFASFDYYYNYGERSWNDHIEDCISGSAGLDFTRGIKQKNFWIMENSAGSTGWEQYGRNLRPGEIRRMTYQNVAHGADGQLWFRWRTSRYGTEQYWHGLLGHDGVPARRYREAGATAGELHQLFKEIEGSVVRSDVGIVMDYDDRWAFLLQKNSPQFDYCRQANRVRREFTRHGINVDYLRPEDDLARYTCIVLLTKYIVSGEYAQKINDYVAGGGILLASFRCGVKDEVNVPYALTLPGLLRDVTGVRVEEYESIPKNESYRIKFGDHQYGGSILADWAIAEHAEVLATYDEECLEAYAALTVNRYGSGTAYYLATVPDDGMLAELVGRIIESAGIPEYGLLPHGIEIFTRSRLDTRYVFVINHSALGRQVPTGITDQFNPVNLVNGKSVDGLLDLPAGEVAVLKVCQL